MDPIIYENIKVKAFQEKPRKVWDVLSGIDLKGDVSAKHKRLFIINKDKRRKIIPDFIEDDNRVIERNNIVTMAEIFKKKTENLYDQAYLLTKYNNWFHNRKQYHKKSSVWFTTSNWNTPYRQWKENMLGGSDKIYRKSHGFSISSLNKTNEEDECLLDFHEEEGSNGQTENFNKVTYSEKWGKEFSFYKKDKIEKKVNQKNRWLNMLYFKDLQHENNLNKDKKAKFQKRYFLELTTDYSQNINNQTMNSFRNINMKKNAISNRFRTIKNDRNKRFSTTETKMMYSKKDNIKIPTIKNI